MNVIQTKDALGNKITGDSIFSVYKEYKEDTKLEKLFLCFGRVLNKKEKQNISIGEIKYEHLFNLKGIVNV